MTIYSGQNHAAMSGWWLPGVSAQFDFVRQRYYWAGAPKVQGDFNTFTVSGTASLGAAGLVVGGVATDLDISVTIASLGLAFPFVAIASFTPSAVATSQYAITFDDNTTNNTAMVGINLASRRVSVVSSNVTQSDQGVSGGSVGVRTTVAGNFKTNNILQSVDGSTGAAADTAATLFTPTILRFGEHPSNTLPLTGTIHHVVIYSGAQSQTKLNTSCSIAHALPL